MEIIIYMAVSANGFISNHSGIPDWLSQEYGEGFFEICQQTKAVIMGRETYNILAPDNLPLKNDGTTVVLTSNADFTSDNPTVVFADKTPKKIVEMLEERNCEEAIIIGGTTTASTFMASGLVDEIYLVVEPVLFGAGLPLLQNTEAEYKLDLAGVEKLNSNTIKIHYRTRK